MIVLQANVVHTDLNPCGGAEQVALAVIQALIGLGYEVELTTVTAPRILTLKNAFGSERIDALFKCIKRTNRFDGLTLAGIGRHQIRDYDITINTHADMLPYYNLSLSNVNFVTYCHYPLVMQFASDREGDYLAYLQNLGLLRDYGKAENKGREPAVDVNDDVPQLWDQLKHSYLLMLKNSTIITNSNFSRNAILDAFSLDENNKAASLCHTTAPIVIAPPVSVNEFRKAGLRSDERVDYIAVISRFNPSKKLENAIMLARMLKKKRIGKGMIIVGGLAPQDHDYYNQIIRMIKTCDLSDYVTCKVNVTPKLLKMILRKAKVYFHPMSSEPFGISIAEAMSAGVIPIVPEFGGQTEFVPEKYVFSSLKDAAMKIAAALNATQEEREKVSNMVASFSNDNFIEKVQHVVQNLL